jgi:hypothetical protein
MIWCWATIILLAIVIPTVLYFGGMAWAAGKLKTTKDFCNREIRTNKENRDERP